MLKNIPQNTSNTVDCSKNISRKSAELTLFQKVLMKLSTILFIFTEEIPQQKTICQPCSPSFHCIKNEVFHLGFSHIHWRNPWWKTSLFCSMLCAMRYSQKSQDPMELCDVMTLNIAFTLLFVLLMFGKLWCLNQPFSGLSNFAHIVCARI